MATEPGISPSGGPGLSERAARGCHVRAAPPSSPRPRQLLCASQPSPWRPQEMGGAFLGSGCLTLGTSGILRSESSLIRGTASWIGIIRCLAGVTPILPFREGPRLWPLDPVLDQPKLLSKAGLVQEVSATSCGLACVWAWRVLAWRRVPLCVEATQRVSKQAAIFIAASRPRSSRCVPAVGKTRARRCLPLL